MEKNKKIFVAGHRGLVGNAIAKNLYKNGYQNICIRTREQLDLRNQTEVEKFFELERPDYVFVAAATVGGVLANSTFPAEFLYNNMAIAMNVIHAAYKYEVKKLLYLGSSCIYPKFAKQPIKEEYLMSGALEKTNEAYAIGKIAGVKLCEYYTKQYGVDFISCMPCNAYGPGDNFDINNSHVIPALIRKTHMAKFNSADSIEIWGSGSPVREFIYMDDLADACVFLMNNYSGTETINIGTGTEITIKELTKMVCEVVGYQGIIKHDLSKPDGTPRKLVDASKILDMGWKPRIDMKEGLQLTYEWYLKNIECM